jgi:hypothetical protein
MDYIIEFKSSIPSTLCDNIINMFEEQTDKYPGVTFSGVNPKIKDTTDFCIPKNNDRWSKIESFLYKELTSKIKKYKILINEKMNLQNNNYGIIYNYFDNKNVFTEVFMIQKYKKNIGKYVYHTDFSLHEKIEKSYRLLTFLWYLNDVENGGETEFWNKYKIKPEKGKLVLFPASWCYPHTGKMPVSSDKYIITGWLYITE